MRMKVESGSYCDALGFQLGQIPTMLDEKHLLPPDVGTGTSDGIAKQPSSRLGHQIWAWPRLSWPEERRRIDTNRGDRVAIQAFLVCVCVHWKLRGQQTAGCCLQVWGKSLTGDTPFTPRQVWFHGWNSYSFIKAVILKYLWCSKKNVVEANEKSYSKVNYVSKHWTLNYF